jgi:hypothetical protein
LIAILKTLTWAKQNPAIDAFEAAQASKYPNDSLFVIGRNIYQSACGCSPEAPRGPLWKAQQQAEHV